MTASLVVAVLLLAGCASQDGGDLEVVVAETESASSRAPEVSDELFRAVGLVLESPDHGPQLCSAGVAASLPPQCGGFDVAGWDWANVEAESVNGTTWGSYVLVGTWDAATETMTLTEPVVVDDGMIERSAPADTEFTTRCPEPAGGWRPVDPATATEEAFEKATAVAEAQAEFGGLWIGPENRDGDYPNNPMRFVMNVITTGDFAAMQGRLREVWGGSLCVSDAPRSNAELLAIQAAVVEVPGFVSSRIDVPASQVVADVFLATVEGQGELDSRFGQGAVSLRGVLEQVT